LLDALLGTEPLAIGDLILAEVLQGFRSDRDFNQARQLLLTFEMVNIVDSQTAIQAAKNFRALRTKGITVRKTVDTLIATCCLQKGHILLHSDRDFEPFATHLGLRVAYHGA
jgi:predicted nucleic acid-binding protein